MPYQATIYRVLIASPGDVAEERKAIPEILQQWNRENSFTTKTLLEAIKWETHSTPEMGDRPQEIVNKQVVRGCDILVAVFWTKLGSPTGRENSGTVEEIQEFLDAGKPVLLYFSGKPVALESVDPDQWSKLQAFKKKCQSEGLISSYQSIEDLRELLRLHLGRTLDNLKKKSEDESLNAEPPASVYEQVSRSAALVSLRSDYENFVKKAMIEWSSERDSQPISLLEAKSLLRNISNGLIEFRSRVTNNTKQFSDLLAEATRRLKVLQRHELYLDGGSSYMEFWREGDGILNLLEIGAVALDDALQANPAERNSLRQAAEQEVEFNRQHLAHQEYSTPSVLRIESVAKLLETNPRLPERLLTNLRAYLQNIRAARDVQITTMGTGGDHTPELVKIEQLLTLGQTTGQQAITDFQLLHTSLPSQD